MRLTILAAAIFVLLPGIPAKAQVDTIPREAIELFDDIYDMDKLRVINPLKLKDDQIDKLIEMIQSWQSRFNKALLEFAMPPLKEIAKEIKETRASMIKGGALPKELDDRIKKIQEEFVKKRDNAEFNTLKGMAEDAKKILTPGQVENAAELARKGTAVDGKPTAKGDDEKFFNLYVLQVFIKYPRITTVLAEVKKARAEAVAASRAEGEP